MKCYGNVFYLFTCTMQNLMAKKKGKNNNTGTVW